MSIDMVDGVPKKHEYTKQSGRPVRIITESTGQHKVVEQAKTTEVRKANVKNMANDDINVKRSSLKSSKSCTNFGQIEQKVPMASSKSNADLQDCKNCDENLIKFIFTKHGIQVISDVETIV